VTLLLDTHLAIWWHLEDRRLPKSVRSAVQSNDGPVFVSQVSFWEMAVKIAVGKASIDLPAFATEIEQLGFSILRITEPQIFEVAALPRFPDHRDPFDRLLVAQARVESLTLLTADARLARYRDFVRVV